MNPAEQSLTNWLCQKTTEAEALLSVDFSRMKGQITKLGGVKYLKNLLSRGIASDSFLPLSQKNRLDLSPEAAVVNAQFAALFEDDEANECFNRLCDAGFYNHR